MRNKVAPFNVQTMLGTVLSLSVWLATYCLIYFCTTLISSTQGTNGLIEILFRELFSSAVGGYLALEAVKKWTPHGNFKFIFRGFCIPVLLFMVVARIVGVFYCTLFSDCIFSWHEQTSTFLAGIAAIIGANLSYQKKRIFKR